MQRMHRILTQWKRPATIRRLLRKLGVDFTLYACDGSWKGQRERSMLIELDGVSRQLAEKAARLIKKLNLQKAVLLQEIPVVSRLL